MKSSVVRFSFEMKRIRIKKGMTQRRLGHAAGLSHNAIYNIEKCGADPSLSTALAIASVLNISLDFYRAMDGKAQ